MGFLFPYSINTIEIENQVPEQEKEKRRKLAGNTVARTNINCPSAKTEREQGVLIHTQEEALCYSGSSSLQRTYHLEARVGTSIDTIMNVLGNSFPTNANFCLSFLVKTFN